MLLRAALLLFGLLLFGLPGPARAEPRISGYAATEPRGAAIASAPPTAPVLILGSDFGTSGAVFFNGIAATTSAWSPTEILALVPQAPSYPSQGPVVVVVNNERAQGPDFTITPPPVANGKLRVTNITAGETLRYPVALLRGTLDGGTSENLSVTNSSSSSPTRTFTTQLFRGQFKALIELLPGENKIDLHASDGSIESLTLRYEPMTSVYRVRVIYLTDNTGATAYPTQKSNDPQDYQAKLATAALLYQTFTAERLHDMGLGRKTFQVETDAQGRVMVRTVRAPRSAAYYQNRTGDQIYSDLYPWLEQRFPMSTAKNLVLMGFSGYDGAKRKPLAHTALGGGGLALFSNLSLFTWPSSLQDVQRAFSDTTRVDPRLVFDDSIGRSRFWALAATTCGVWMHELGHTFELDHSSDALSIMNRGHDYFNRFFTFWDPPHAGNPGPFYFSEKAIPYWDKTRATRLSRHRWFRPD